MDRKYIGFKRYAILTVVSVYLLILAGGIVRTTGSGMGCPDWPKCFGKWIPPTQESELPANYKEIYTVHGYDTEFNAVKTWIEYINRLLGALIGIFVILAFVLSFRFKTDKTIPWLCGLALLMTILEGVVGKFVVSTNLHPWVISFHLWGSVLVILLLIYVMTRVNKDSIQYKITNIEQLKKLNIIVIFVTFLQILIGTQVRQQIDRLSVELGFERRAEWIQNLDYFLEIHRLFSIVVFFANLYFAFRVFKASSDMLWRNSSIGIVALIFIELIGGVVMGNFNIPSWIQPIHMLVAIMLLGLQFFILFVIQWNEQKKMK